MTPLVVAVPTQPLMLAVAKLALGTAVQVVVVPELTAVTAAPGVPQVKLPFAAAEAVTSNVGLT